MSMIQCKECGAEVSKSAKVCPKCGKKLKHTGLRIFLAILFVIIGIGALASSGNENLNNTSSESSSTSKSVVTKENYDKIEKGMTKTDVKEILGEPTSVSENETPRNWNYGIKSLSRGFFAKSNRYILFRW